MKSIKLKLNEIIALRNELLNSNTGEGLLREPVTFTTKFYLNQILQKLDIIVNTFEKTRIDHVNRLGILEEGMTTKHIPRQIKNEKSEMISNPAFDEFMSEIKVLLEDTEYDIEYHAFAIQDFNSINSNSFYPTFYKLVDN